MAGLNCTDNIQINLSIHIDPHIKLKADFSESNINRLKKILYLILCVTLSLGVLTDI